MRFRLGDPRVVPCFRCLLLLDMPPSETSGSPSGARAQFFPDGIGLNRVSSGSALPSTPVIRFRRARHFAASLRFAFATACRVVGPLDGSDRAFAQPQGLLLPSFRSSRSPSSSSGIATVVSEHFHRWYFQPLEQQLASLHWYHAWMVRPVRRAVLAGESPVRVSAGAPGSRLQPGGEIRPCQAECQKPIY